MIQTKEDRRIASRFNGLESEARLGLFLQDLKRWEGMDVQIELP